ncbi:MAG: hypothetical protein LIO94_04060 [Clostridiales bacterium]|nr:hypothetical protein [Clostridiales bacterium]
MSAATGIPVDCGCGSKGMHSHYSDYNCKEAELQQTFFLADATLSNKSSFTSKVEVVLLDIFVIVCYLKKQDKRLRIPSPGYTG